MLLGPVQAGAGFARSGGWPRGLRQVRPRPPSDIAEPAVICRCWQRGGEVGDGIAISLAISISLVISIAPQPCRAAAGCVRVLPPHRLFVFSGALPCRLITWLFPLPFRPFALGAAFRPFALGAAQASCGECAVGSSGGAAASVPLPSAPIALARVVCRWLPTPPPLGLWRLGLWSGLGVGSRRRAAAAAGPVVTCRRWRESWRRICLDGQAQEERRGRRRAEAARADSEDRTAEGLLLL